MYRVLGFLIFVIISCNPSKENTSNDVQLNLKQGMEVFKNQGVITKISAQNFEDTYTTLVEVLTNNPNLKIITQLDHQANAASVGLELNPTRIIMFGNPKLGTPLMQDSQITALDLPQKILVWQDDQGIVKVSYNDPQFLKLRHTIKSKEDILTTIAKALDNITAKATIL